MATAKKTPKTSASPRKPAAKKPGATKVAPKPAPMPAVKAAAAPKADKPKKPKLVRDSFTIPKTEYMVLQALKERAARGGAAAKKSEILRAGIKALAAMGDAAFASALGAVPAIKTGRPAKQ